MACRCTSSGQCHKCSRSCRNPAQKGVFPSPSFSCCSCDIIFGRHWQNAPTPSKSTVCKVSCWMPMSLMKRNFVPPEVEVNVWDMPSFFLMRRSCSRKVSANVYWNNLCKTQHCWLVLSISSKSGGKNGTHCWVPEISSIAAISYAPVQIFEHFIGRQFRAVPQK